ncbi:PQQ-binding-like beta-propeller repeat protein [Mycolicibacterium sp.]|uniref:PQQ-binding-like beta-propeller repeat protein n=1 Tax=Mycolicibacterium sp. TaxID=2320850 RepID=UPI003D13CF68
MGFNPPPGWPVPRGWDPPPDWTPDPSWPPAPAGWQFWIDEPTIAPAAPTPAAGPVPTAPVPGPTSRPARRLWPIAIVAVVVLVLAGVVGGGYLLFNRSGNSEANGPVAGQLRGTYPDKPSAGWRVSPGQVFTGAEFVRPDATSYQYLRPGFIGVDDTLITAAVLPQSDRGATLVAIDAGSGEIRWTAEAGFKPACATATVDGLLPCVGREANFGPPDAAQPTQVSFIRMSDGSIDHQIPVSDSVRAVEVHGDAVYTMAFDPDPMSRIITRGTADDLTADWSRDFPLTRDNEGCPGSGDTLIDGVEDGVVYSGNDGGVVVADAADGHPLVPKDAAQLVVFAGQGITVKRCDPTDLDNVTTTVIDRDGTTLRTIPGDGYVADPWLLAPDTAVPYIIDRTAYDFGTGEQLWTASGAGDWWLRTIIGDTVIGGGGYRSVSNTHVMEPVPFEGVDLATGEHLWTSEVGADLIEMSDGRHFMAITGDGLVAVDLATGEQVWALPGIERSGYLGPAGSGFAYMQSESVTFYPPTGGPATAPGRTGGDTAAAEEAGAGGMITKCGRTPEMRPLEYRAEGGALIVTMEVKASCPSGDIVSTDRLRVTVRDELGLICSGVFDFSADPLVLGGDGVQATTVQLVFTEGMFTRHPNTLGEHSGRPSSSADIVTQAAASGTELVDCEDEGTSSGPRNADRPAGPAEVQSQPKAPGDNASGCISDADALAALRAQVDADRPFVQAQLENRWVAQLSSKQPGLVAPDVDGRVVTWTPCEILQQHLRMRGQYPEVRLVWSDEWRTFDLAGWWVTVAGVTFPDADAANGWCDARAIPVDECFAKIISNSGDPRGSTKYRG